MRKTCVVLIALLAATPARAQITIPNSFLANTVADPNAVNADFTQLGNQALNRTGGTMTGTLTSQTVAPAADNMYGLGDGAHRFTAAYAVTFNGSGAGLTALVPTQLTGSGRIPMAADYFPAFVSKTTTYNASATADDDIDCDATAAGFTVTLPTPVGNTGKTFNVKKIDGSANACTVGTAAGTIDGSSTFVIGLQNQNMTFRSNGTNWEIR